MMPCWLLMVRDAFTASVLRAACSADSFGPCKHSCACAVPIAAAKQMTAIAGVLLTSHLYGVGGVGRGAAARSVSVDPSASITD